jgi:hypothetical protein
VLILAGVHFGDALVLEYSAHELTLKKLRERGADYINVANWLLVVCEPSCVHLFGMEGASQEVHRLAIRGHNYTGSRNPKSSSLNIGNI